MMMSALSFVFSVLISFAVHLLVSLVIVSYFKLFICLVIVCFIFRLLRPPGASRPT